MKLMSDIAKGYLPETTESSIVDFQAINGGWKKLDAPILSHELSCLECNGKEHYAVYCKPEKESPKVWICEKGDCLTNTSVKTFQATLVLPNPQRAILWHVWCQNNDLGNMYHDLKFDDIKQSTGKISFMLKFVDKPQGILFMQGTPGTGKTFACLGICEMFTRRNISCIFTTQTKMLSDWLDSRMNGVDNYVNRLINVSLLVIDDFGTSEVTPGFMRFFLDLINSRMQWDDRGTIITTNLGDDKFSEFCGEALTDRINTGQHFEFKGKTRRVRKSI